MENFFAEKLGIEIENFIDGITLVSASIENRSFYIISQPYSDDTEISLIWSDHYKIIAKNCKYITDLIYVDTECYYPAFDILDLLTIIRFNNKMFIQEVKKILKYIYNPAKTSSNQFYI